jgi:hypothetical protein
MAYHKEAEIIGQIAGEQCLDLTTDDAANAGLLADCWCVVNGNACHK